MEVVSISSSAARMVIGISTKLLTHRTNLKKPLTVVAFKASKTDYTTLINPPEKTSLPAEPNSSSPKRIGKAKKSSQRVKSVFTDESPSCTLDLDYNEAAAKLESIFKLSPTTEPSIAEEDVSAPRKEKKRGKRIGEDDDNLSGKSINDNVVRSQTKKVRRLNLDNRIALKSRKDELKGNSIPKKTNREDENKKIDRLVREYSVSGDLVSLDWKKMKIPPVLPSSEHAWLFKLMQPMKAVLQVKEDLHNQLEREPTEGELAKAVGMDTIQVRRQMEVGHAARNKLIKHNLRLVLFVINKYFEDFANGTKFQDLCQAGVKGLITAIDRFEFKRKFRLSTYALFWIRHGITRSMTLSSFTRVSFGLDSVRVEIQKAKMELLFRLKRLPTEDEIIAKVGISSERYHEVLRASKPVLSLQSKHATTKEEYINVISDVDGAGGDNRRQAALLRLALDDVLDSLKPKESLVIRQRYGLDGKGDRTMGEIAGNLNISREMVRKHEVKALMKLKHPARVDYLRRYVI